MTPRTLPGQAPQITGADFDEFYYRHCCGEPYARTPEWLARFDALAANIIARFQPASVLDAGCAIGLLVETLRARGVDAEGIDLSAHAISQVPAPLQPFCRCACDGAAHAPLRSDRVHRVRSSMNAADGETAIANFASTPTTCSSRRRRTTREPTHERAAGGYQVEMFARYGLVRDLEFDGGFLAPWVVRFRRTGDPMARVVRAYERQHWDLVRKANEARAYSIEVQAQWAASERQADEARATIAAAEQHAAAAEQRAAAAEHSVAALAAANTELRIMLGARDDTIAHMQRSRFWRVRDWYLRARKSLKRGARASTWNLEL